nr:helitron helicase-like domain-containing protein [Tanacetum cinerariifolium]
MHSHSHKFDDDNESGIRFVVVSQYNATLCAAKHFGLSPPVTKPNVLRVHKHEIITFPNTNKENRRPSHVNAKHSHGHAKFARNEAFITNRSLTPNVYKRENLHPLSTLPHKETSSSRNIRRRLLHTLSEASRNRNDPNVHTSSLDSNLAHRQAYMELGAYYARQAEYHLCCGERKIYMPPDHDPPVLIQQLLKDAHFLEHIRAYNQMFAMTSFGAKIDDSVNTRRGLYVFKISKKIHHWIGSLCPEEGYHSRFLQLYIYDTQSKVNNRMHHFAGLNEGILNPEIVQGLIHVLDEHNGLVRLFRTARDRCSVGDVSGFKIRFYNMGGVRGYELPTSGYTILEIIEGDVFDRLHDEDAVSLCFLGILQLVLLGVEAKRRIPDWLLRLANDRTWILESFRVTTNNYYYRYNRYPRVADWKKKRGSLWAACFYDFFHGNLPTARLTPDETEA